MKTLTLPERARRAVVLGITLPAQATPPQAHGATGKLTATPEPPVETARPSAPAGPNVYERFKRVRGLLQARYPQIFSWARPLAIGIDLMLREAFSEEELPTADLKAFLRIWVHRHAYRAALKRGDRRVNLDGSDAGPALAFAETGSTAEATEGGDQNFG